MYEFNQRDDCTELRIFAYAILNDPIKIKAEYKKLHIIIEQGASTSIIDAVYAMHQEISMIVSSGATLCYYMNGIIAQEKQCARTMNITIAENACVAVISSLQCAGFFSLRCTALLSGAKAYFFAGSTIMVLPTGNYFQQITQKHTHSQTGSDSRLYGIVETMGRLESNGLITVESKADRSIAEHSSKCLTAGVGAKAFAKPMLEIVPKNVFVKHGAAIGPLDIGLLRALYYRGIQPDEAKKLLKRAFLAQIKAFWPDWVKNSSRGFPFESAF
jgi:hypothetical protein